MERPRRFCMEDAKRLTRGNARTQMGCEVYAGRFGFRGACEFRQAGNLAVIDARHQTRTRGNKRVLVFGHRRHAHASLRLAYPLKLGPGAAVIQRSQRERLTAPRLAYTAEFEERAGQSARPIA
ncbi:hypothetical protein BN961_02634 [Afipia felis]|uniref:Uncharacterized protein n=1 Tax=Afipia felis TaxID=1035 RepID=A0A090MPB9_AFIFE|nr:hypothetical protein BN961_02634 [Afipia felis]